MAKHDRTLSALFAEPARANIAWKDIEGLIVSLGATVEEGSGSRVRFTLNGFPATFHRPHPGKEATRPIVRSARDFLKMAGITPPDEEG
jgi:hypothetical protein